MIKEKMVQEREKSDLSQQQYEEALIALVEQRHGEALELLNRCLEVQRRNPEVLYARAVTSISLGSYRKAACDLLKTIALDRDFLDAYKQLGFVQFMLGKEEDALKTLAKGLEIDPGYTEIYCVLGDIYIDLGEFDKAKETFEKALELEPENPEPHSKLALYYLARGDMKGLQREYELLKTLDAALAEQIGTLFFDTP
ncbi:MAG: tetratricopeptide repeat protein [Chlorobium sp.]